MRLARTVTLAGIVLGAGALAAGFAPDAAAVWYAGIGLVALLWLAAHWRGWGWATSTAFVLLVALAATGVLLGHPPLWMAAAVTLGMTGWALGGYVRRLAALPNVEDADGRARSFTLRLLALDAVALVLAAFALRVELRLTLALAVLLGALLIAGLSRVIAVLRRASV